MISASMVLPDVGFTHVNLVMGILADPAAYAERMKALEAANAEARAAIDEANARTAAADERDAESKAECNRRLDAVDQEILNRRNGFEQEMARRSQELRGREMVVAERLAAAERDATESAAMKTDLRRRLDIVASAA